MKLGDIKLQALSLIYPDLSVEYDEGCLGDKVYELKSSPNCASYLIGSVGAINRAFALIEGRLLSGTGAVTLNLTGENVKSGVIFIDSYDDILKINQVKINGSPVAYQAMERKIKVDSASLGKCEITYFKKIKRINHLSGSDYEISLNGIEEFLPYYIKWELLCSENQEEALNARSVFEKALTDYESALSSGTLSETVYSLRRI